ncbi:hypothetical protein DNU06_09985 [Putridiphycobacter roseus]|uniref:Uncharacterized protein n=1 Tax=Putridiphycobacter roseus TaxID=2219161 RepID=A0A2W1N041_9FLAO|nr:hypothetical protein [Putridiphycobacter roseus]PZE17064.1 hypothetical protein DNU06_09985 [Putridiphycobacter roseus]
MPIVLRNIFAILLGVLIGSLVNMALITLSPSIIPIPEGVDNTTAEGLKAGIHLFQPQHFIMPFLAHAIGTFIGALFAARIAGSHKMSYALVLGFFFLIGGIMMASMLPSPLWFNITDLALAYLPMAWLGGKLGSVKIA